MAEVGPETESLPESPRIGVMIAAYNAAHTLCEALDSVLAQQYANWQVAIVDDGSADDTFAVARGYADCDTRIQVLSQANAGAGAARNVALSVLDADYVTYLDADDRLSDRYMAVMMELMREYPGRDIYSSDGLFVHADGTTSSVFGYKDVVQLKLEDLLRECRILGGGALVKAEVLRELGGFREHMYGEDYDLWLRALAAGKTHVATPEPLYIYHRNVSGQKSEDVRSGSYSAVRALTELIESGVLTANQERIARRSIVNFSAGPGLEEQAQRFRAGVERVLGKRLAVGAMRLLHTISWTVRPLRRIIAHRRRRSDLGKSDRP